MKDSGLRGAARTLPPLIALPATVTCALICLLAANSTALRGLGPVGAVGIVAAWRHDTRRRPYGRRDHGGGHRARGDLRRADADPGGEHRRGRGGRGAWRAARRPRRPHRARPRHRRRLRLAQAALAANECRRPVTWGSLALSGADACWLLLRPAATIRVGGKMAGRRRRLDPVGPFGNPGGARGEHGGLIRE